MQASEPYFGKSWETAVYNIQYAYLELLNTIETKGFGLGGLVFTAELVSREQRTDTLDEMKIQ